MPVTVLKKKHTLKGKNITMKLKNRYKDFKLPSLRGDFSYARLSTNKKTEDTPLDDLR